MNRSIGPHQRTPVVAQLLSASEVHDKYGHVVNEEHLVLCTPDIPGMTSAALAMPSGGIHLESYTATHMLFVDKSEALWCVFDTANMWAMEYLTFGLLGGFYVLFVLEGGGSRLVLMRPEGGHESKLALAAADFWERELLAARDEIPAMFFRLCDMAALSKDQVAPALGLSLPPSAVHLRCVVREAATHK